MANEKEYTIEEVEQHYIADDFWTVIDNVVYDVSGFAEAHPGGRSIIMHAAGADSTVLFHTSHIWEPEKSQKVLKKFRIGVLAKDRGFVSPNMGDFWRDASKRVIAFLKEQGVSRHPLRGKVYYFMDTIIFLAMYCFFAFGLRTHTTPLWIMALFHCYSGTCIATRITGQAHVNGHEQIFDPRSNFSEWADCLLHLMVLPPIYAFTNPQGKNGRRLLNHPRSVSQYEHVLKRGFGEHNAIHHVKGAHLEDDGCHTSVTFSGMFRLSGFHPWMPWHQFQATWWYGYVLCLLMPIAAPTFGTVFIPHKVAYIMKNFFVEKDYIRSLCMTMGLLTGPVLVWGAIALPYSGIEGFKLFLLLGVLRYQTATDSVMLFWGNHVWDYGPVDEAVANRDWGRHNLACTRSWWPNTVDKWLHPFLWNAAGGTPTFSYHIEHTLFPCLNYLHYPLVAPIVRDTCKEYGIKYNGLYSTNELIKARAENLVKWQNKVKAA